MLRDVFYYGNKPNVHPREKFAKNLDDARSQATTVDFWIINEYCDYREFDWDFDFEFLHDDDVWAEDHINVWPSQHQKDSGTWLCNTANKEPLLIYRADVEVVKHKNLKSDRWVELDTVNHARFDFSWHPDPTDPPYIYKWGSKFAPVQFKTCLEYHAPGATQIKYMDQIVELLPNTECWVEFQSIDKDKFDMSWRPDPMDPPMIYVWGNKYIDGTLRSTLEYHVPGATERKYMPELVSVLPEWDRWVEHVSVDKTKGFDFSWRPDPREPAYNYVWGNKYEEAELKPTLEYRMLGATEIKYMEEKVDVLPQWNRWVEVQQIDKDKFDMSWRPDPREPPYIYVWGNKYIDGTLRSTLEYHCPGATEIKYMTNDVAVMPEKNRWKIIESVKDNCFDFSWRPDPREPALIYVFGNEVYDAVKMPTIEYHCIGATERKYMDNLKASLAPNIKLYEHLEDSTLADYSWLPDPDSPPYIYAWGNQWNKPEDKISIQFVVQDATEVKYMEARSVRKPCMDNWIIPKGIDDAGFDYSWEPSPADPPFIYEFGTQWQKTGGPRYVVEGATEVKYVDLFKVKHLSSGRNWTLPTNIDFTEFDFSWHPDDTSPPYIYVFPTQWALSGGPTYTVEGATEIKYVEDLVAKAVPDKTNWIVPAFIDEESFDFSWHPYAQDEPYIYQFGTQHQKTGGPVYKTPGVHENSAIKYIDTRILKATRLPSKKGFAILGNNKIQDFDYSWHPDTTDDPFIYVFGNTQYPAEIMPTIEYAVPGATQIKYINEVVATLGPDRTNWVIIQPINEDKFDFSWKPNPKDPPYIYAWGNPYIDGKIKSTIEYRVDEATEYKYMDSLVEVTPEWDRWIIPDNLDTTSFDFTWRPDPLEEPLLWQFGTQWQKTGGPCYVMPEATETKYIDFQKAIALPNKKNWVSPSDIEHSMFDYSWHPDSTETPYVYEFGTQWQKTGGPIYLVEGASETKYVNTNRAIKKSNKLNWYIPEYVDEKSFDFSWHPDSTDDPFNYEFTTKWQSEGGPVYKVEDATETKYVTFPVANTIPVKSKWTIPTKVDTTDFDFTWHPHPRDPAFIYEFGTQWQKTGGPCYVVEGATVVKFVDVTKAIALPNKKNWVSPADIEHKMFDYSWHPDNTETPYVYEFGTQWQKTGGPIYIVEGASEIKYVDTQRAIKKSNKLNWYIPTYIDKKSFDFSWHPDSTDDPFNYEFTTVWQSEGGPVYKVEDAKETKYVTFPVANTIPIKDKWTIPDNIDTTNFDFSWHPHPRDPAFIYEFGTQWQQTSGPRYVVADATEVKFVDVTKAKALPNKNNWTLPTNIDVSDFDFSWHPDANSPPYIYVFPTQWALSGGPIYTVEGATEIKYVEDLVAKAMPDKTNWEVPAFIDEDSFDFSWHPYAQDEPYVYQFGTQWQKTGGPVYKTPGVHVNSAVKYIDTRILKSKRLPSKKGFATLGNNKIQDFNYSWHPDTTEEPFIYIFGNKQYPGEIMPTIEYVVPGAKQIKYISNVVATLAPDLDRWVVPDNLDVSEFDFSWKPNPKDPDYIYQFGTQWQKTNGPKYIVNDATEIKYVEDSKAKATARPNDRNWHLPDNIEISEFDYSWHPDDTENIPYIYVFGTQWALSGGPKYIAPGASVVKYVEEPIAKVAPNRKNWVIPDDIDVEEFDFSWHPYSEDEPYIYQFGTQWQASGGPKYIAPECDDMSPIKYIDTRVLKAKKLPNFTNWEIPANVDRKSFDFSWQPGVEDKPYIYEFGTQWQKTGGPRYVMPSAVDVKFVNVQKATVLPDRTNWVIPKGVDVSTFDFSWHPDSTAPKYVYQFGTIADPNDGPRYLVHGNDGEMINLERVETASTELICSQYFIETSLEDLIQKHPTELFWALNPDLDYSTFDFTWRPSIEQANYVHAFGSEDNINTQTYFVNAVAYNKGFTEINYVEGKMEVKTKIDMYFVDRGNEETKIRFEKLKQQFPDIQKTRYLNSWVDTINRCINRSTTNLCWILNSELDYTGFDFNYYPNPWQMKMVHVFGTQWSHWGTTFMVNRETFAEDTKYIKIIEHLSNLNFLKDRRATATNVLYDIVYIDHGNMGLHEAGKTIVKYEESYFNTFKKLLDKLSIKKEHYIWICSSICDYNGFDFTYICDPFAREQLHVFPSDKQKFGDTFLVNVNKLRELISDMEKLEDYEKINYNQHQRTKRLAAPVIVTEGDSHVSSIDSEYNFPYATFVTSENKDIQVIDTEPMNLWSSETKNIIITSAGGTRITVPKEVKEHVKRELYDYPYIITNSKLAKSTTMDIVFLSNGETGADENYEHLLRTTHGLDNRVVRVDGVNGRVAAYHAAAQASNTAWMFTVFAKLKVSNKFDWNWQPDRLQIPKHYVFHAKNPVNGLVYGHQAMIAYNKKLTLANEGKGLDFTMDDEHEIVEINSGVANFNTDEWSTWRTAFREALKLRANTDDISKNRLEFWLTVGSGKFSQYSMDGATDAVQYYEEVNGDFDKLKLSYEWDWLRAFYDSKYK